MTKRPYGITPAYYRACAVQAAFEIYRPLALSSRADLAPGDPMLVAMPLDPACDELLRAMGVRERQKLANVPHDLSVSNLR